MSRPNYSLFGQIYRINQIRKVYCYGTDIYDHCGSSRIEDLWKDFTILEPLGLPGVERPHWKAIYKILYRPYFSRI